MANGLKNALWLIVGAVVAVWAVTSLVGLVQAGPMDPPGPPGGTMKTLDAIPPSWHQQLDASNGNPTTGCGSDRFQCVLLQGIWPSWDWVGVLDKETGLVWQRQPRTATMTWDNASRIGGSLSCGVQEIGGRFGWRLPTAEELASLLYDSPAEPNLPAGHPFVGVSVTNHYWSSTSYTDTSAVLVRFFGSSPQTAVAPKADLHLAWCVRGGYGYDFNQ